MHASSFSESASFKTATSIWTSVSLWKTSKRETVGEHFVVYVVSETCRIPDIRLLFSVVLGGNIYTRNILATTKLINYLHFADVGSFIVQALEEGRDTEEAPNPVVHNVSNAFAIRCKSNLYPTEREANGSWNTEQGCSSQ